MEQQGFVFFEVGYYRAEVACFQLESWIPFLGFSHKYLTFMRLIQKRARTLSYSEACWTEIGTPRKRYQVVPGAMSGSGEAIT